jgi:PAS domain S-box-containing protein
MLVETSHDLIWSVDAEGRWTFVNAAARSIYGYEPGEMLGRPFMEFETPEQARKDLEVFALIKSGVPYFNYETVHLRKDGTPVHLSYNAVVHRDPEGRVLGTTGTARDITERTRAETALREREHELRLITNHLPGPVSRVGPDLRYRFVNDHYERIFGRSREAIIGHTMEELLGAEHFQRIEPYVRRVQQGEAVTYESALRTPAGEVRHMLVNLVPERDGGDGAAGFYVIATDITERKRAEDALRDSESRARRLFDSGLQGALITSTEGVIAQANDTFLRMLGYTRDDLTAGRLSWKKLTPPEFVERDDRAVQEILTSGYCTP